MNLKEIPTETLIDMISALSDINVEEYSAYKIEDFTDKDIKNLIELNHLSIELYRRKLKF